MSTRTTANTTDVGGCIFSQFGLAAAGRLARLSPAVCSLLALPRELHGWGLVKAHLSAVGKLIKCGTLSQPIWGDKPTLSAPINNGWETEMRHWPLPVMKSTDEEILGAARYARSIRDGRHTVNGNALADLFDGLVALTEAANADDAHSAAEALADAAQQLLTEKEEELA